MDRNLGGVGGEQAAPPDTLVAKTLPNLFIETASFAIQVIMTAGIHTLIHQNASQALQTKGKITI